MTVFLFPDFILLFCLENNVILSEGYWETSVFHNNNNKKYILVSNQSQESETNVC